MGPERPIRTKEFATLGLKSSLVLRGGMRGLFPVLVVYMLLHGRMSMQFGVAQVRWFRNLLNFPPFYLRLLYLLSLLV